MSGSLSGATISGSDPTAPYNAAMSAGAQRGGPLGTLGQAVDIQKSMAQAQMLQRENAFQQSIGGVLQQSMNPDGTPDPTRLFVNMAKNPATAFKAADYLQQQATIGNINAETAVKQLAMANKQAESWGADALSLVPLGPSVTRDDVIGRLMTGLKEGRYSPQEVTAIMSQVPQNGAAINGWLKSMGLRAMDAVQGGNAVLGQIHWQNFGNVAQPMVESPVTGVHPAGPPTPMGASPELQSQTTTEMRNGVPTTVPLREKEALPMSGGYGTGANYANFGTGGSGNAVPGGAGAPQPSAGAQNAVANAKTAAAGAPPPGGWQSGFSPEETSVRAKLFPEINGEADVAGRTLPLLQNMVKEVQQGATYFGGGASTRANLAQWAQKLGASDKIVNAIAGGDLAAAQTFMKNQLLSSVATMAGAGVGQVTNDKFNTFAEKIMSQDMDPKAIVELGQELMAMQRLSMQKQQFYNKYVVQGGLDARQFDARWNGILEHLPDYKRIANPDLKSLARTERNPAPTQSQPQGQQ